MEKITLNGTHIILDAGHGGRKHTKGKRSPKWEDGKQYFEGEGNRNIVKKVVALIDKFNKDNGVKIPVHFTVKPDDMRDTPLYMRVNKERKVYQLAKGKTIFISIHSDGFDKESAHGWTVYTSKGETKSDPIADIFHKHFKEVFPNEKHRANWLDGDSDKEANFYVLRKTYGRAILLENFFHTNKRECQEILQTKEGQNKIAEYIFNGIIECVTMKKLP